MKSVKKPSSARPKPPKEGSKATRKKPSSKPKPPTAHEEYLNQNIIINSKDRHLKQFGPPSSRKVISAMTVKNPHTQRHKRASTVLGMIYKSIERRLTKVNVNSLVTEEDVLRNEDYGWGGGNAGEEDEKESQATGLSGWVTARRRRLSEEQAALLIQKMWRGHQTRKLITRYVKMMSTKKAVVDTQQLLNNNSFNETKKYNKKHGRRLSDLVDMEKTQKINTGQLKEAFEENNTYKSEVSPEKEYEHSPTTFNQRLQKLKQTLQPDWKEMLGLISDVPNMDSGSKSLLIQLINKIHETNPIHISESSSYEVERPPQTQIIVNNKQKAQPQQMSYISSVESSPPKLKLAEIQHPWLKVLEVRMKMTKAREKEELLKVENRRKRGEISEQVYQIQKERVIGRYLRERKEVLDHMEQISLGVEKCNETILKAKIDANFLYQVCGKDYSIRHSLSSETLIEQFIKCRDIFLTEQDEENYEQLEQIERFNQNRTQTELQSPSKSSEHERERDYIQQQAQLSQYKSSTQKIQEYIEQILIEDICRQIYLSDVFYKAFQPLIDLHHNYNFSKVTDKSIQQFLETIESRFMPTVDVLLVRLNQKINPTPTELLKILRNEEVLCSENEFYELVIPETSFKSFREWKERQGALEEVNEINWPFHCVPNTLEDLKWRERALAMKDKKKRLVKFQKDLQAMYYKSVFNCFNQCIIDVKSNLSPLNGRSTIGPGQLRVSMQDSNIKVPANQVPMVISKAKQRVTDNIKYKCPTLEASNYLSLYRFQDALTKQIKHEFDVNQYKWVSFFDEVLELAVELSKIVELQLIAEFEKEIEALIKS